MEDLSPHSEFHGKPRAPCQAQEGVPGGKEEILLVEDEDVLRKLGARLLAASGYFVIIAANGPEALKKMTLRGKAVGLVVTDVVMPGMSGRDLARELARLGLARRVLYMSGYADSAIVSHGVLQPGLAFICKPFTTAGMLRKVREVLDGPEAECSP